MIEVHKDALGNVSGYFDTEKKSWVPPPESAHTSETELTDDSTATDEDDAGEPVDFTTWTKDQLKDALDDAGVTYPKNANKDELVALMQAEAT